MEVASNIDIPAAKPQHRKKVVVTASRSECVYKRTGEPNVPFCERGGARQRADVFLQRKTEQSSLCSDVEAPPGIEPGIKVLQTSALPLGYGAEYFKRRKKDCVFCKKWSGRRDSNSRRSPWQGDALPLSHSRKWCLRVESNRRHRDFQSLALPTELQRHLLSLL